MQTFQTWVGLAVYLAMDGFAASFFANVIAHPSFHKVFKREYKAGLYSPSVYYFGMWFAKIKCLSFYPVLLLSLSFSSFQLIDDSRENLFRMLKAGAAQSFSAVSLGHMWSYLFEEEMNTIVTAFFAMNIFTCGAGLLHNGEGSPLVKALIWMSP